MAESIIRAVLFDMDGVLLDSEALYDSCWSLAAAEYGLSVESVLAVRWRCLGQTEISTVAALKSAFGERFPAMRFYRRTDEIALSLHAPAKPSAAEVLGAVKEQGLALALASSSDRQTVQRMLENAGLWSFFAEAQIVCGDEVSAGKPSPEIYLAAAGKTGFDASQCVAVEDSPSGVESAFRAGIRCIMVPDRVQPDDEVKSKAWKICRSLKDMLPILG